MSLNEVPLVAVGESANVGELRATICAPEIRAVALKIFCLCEARRDAWHEFRVETEISHNDQWRS
jgi:hypothetical protein